MSRRVAAIDIGTNTVLMLIAEEREGELRCVEDHARITRLGKGVDRTKRRNRPHNLGLASLHSVFSGRASRWTSSSQPSRLPLV